MALKSPMRLLTKVTNEKGCTLDVHDACVLDRAPRFKGAIWAPTPPTGIVMWHNSGFSNWYPFTDDAKEVGRFTLSHADNTFSFSNSEAVIMAVKERVATRLPLSEFFAKHAALTAEVSKKAAAKAGDAYPLWADHTFQVLLGAAACLLKFSQDRELQKALLQTADCVLVETAPYDGAWGVAKNSSSFLDSAELPEHYTLQSTEESEFSFTAGSYSGTRKRREANALGKALMLVRSFLKNHGETALSKPTLAAALEAAYGELQRTPGANLMGVRERMVDLEFLLEFSSSASIPKAPMPLLTEVIDEKGCTLDFHDACVLERANRFKGAIWAPTPPSGVVMWHNSGFSNWYPFTDDESAPGRFTLLHTGNSFSFSNSEAVIMAVKERIATRAPLSECLARHAALTAKASKEAVAGLKSAYPLWGDHTFQVLLGAVACLLKFSQVPELRDELLQTADCVLVETAPNDGSWGVAKSSSDFLISKELPEHYTLQSKEASEFTFTAGSWSGSRKRCEANSLGKALMLVRGLLQKSGDTPLSTPTLAAALQDTYGELQKIPGVNLIGVPERMADLDFLFECSSK